VLALQLGLQLDGASSRRLTVVSVTVATLMFAALAGPVVLLGVSAARFPHHFWTWFAPAVFAAAAMQGIVTFTPALEAQFWPVLRAGLLVVAITALAVALRERLAPAAWRRLMAWRQRRPRLAALAGLLALGGLMLAATAAEQQVAMAALGGCAIGALVIWLCWVTLVDRTKRIVAPLLATGYFAACAGFALAGYGAVRALRPEHQWREPAWVVAAVVVAGLLVQLVVLLRNRLTPGLPWTLRGHGPWRLLAVLGSGGLLALLGSAVVLGLLPGQERDLVPVCLFVAAGSGAAWLARDWTLAWLGLAYERKVFSDAQFQVMCWLLSVAMVTICVGSLLREDLQLIDRRNVWQAAATVLALVAYWVATRRFVPPLPCSRRLLVLRVFSRGEHAERLLDELEQHWRHIGPIALIGGKDVAARTIDPAKAASFLRKRLGEIFVPDAVELGKRVAAMDEKPDPDGRYRVNEFFCFDDLWQGAVLALLPGSEAVVVDLSEFSAERHGTAWELEQLARHGALARSLLIVSHRTDMAALRQALHLAPDAPLPEGLCFEAAHALEGERLVDALLARMDAPAPQALRAASGLAAPA
jgi:hypothetical protein